MAQLEIDVDPRRTGRGLSPWQLMRLRFRLRLWACSETWIDDSIITTTDIDADGDLLTYSYYDSRVFPPGGRRLTKMRWCRSCGRYTPPQAIALIEHRAERFGPVISATLACDDCRIAQDEEDHRELYHAGLHLRPTGSQSFISRRALRNERQPRRES